MGLKIANIIEEGRLGGPQIRIAEVAKHLTDEGIETSVILPNYKNEAFKKKLARYNIKTACFPLHRLTKDKRHLLRYVIFFLYEIIIVYKYFKKKRFDIVHCSGGSWQYKGVIAGKLAGSITLWHLNDTNMPIIVRFLFRLVARYFADGFIVAGQRVKEYYLERLDFRTIPIFEIQAPVDTSVFDPDKVKKDKKIMECPGLKIVTVGNINPSKGIEYFIEMASILNKQYKNLIYYIVGPIFNSQKNYSKKVFNMVQNFMLKNIHFYGPSENIPSLLKAADIYVCSSIAEASPVSLWEAMAMAKPIIATDVGDVSRFITDGENGFVVPTKDSGALAEKTGLLIQNESIRKKFGHKARRVARQHLDIDICIKKHKQSYENILKKNLGPKS